MAKSFNFTLFFKKNEDALLFVGLALIALFVFGVNADFVGSIQIFKKEPAVEEVKRVGGGCQLIEGFDEEQWNALSHNDKVPYCGMAPVASAQWEEIGGPPTDIDQFEILGTWCNVHNTQTPQTPQTPQSTQQRCRLKDGNMAEGEQCRQMGRQMGNKYRKLSEKISEAEAEKANKEKANNDP